MTNFYWSPPSPEKLALTKWKETDYQAPEVELWEENWDVFHLYLMHQTQWRMGPGGPSGLDMTVFLHELDRKKLPSEDYDMWIAKLGVIEQAAARAMRH